MRELIYGVEGKCANNQTIACDERGDGGANHVYQIIDVSHANVPDTYGGVTLCDIEFQNGPISNDGNDTNGVNGIQNEDLLAIVIDRLEGFQNGPYACDENQAALNFCKCALEALNARTRNRVARNVEGTHTV